MDVGDVLALMHGARDRYTTTQATLTRVIDHGVRERAMVREATERLRRREGRDAASLRDTARGQQALAERAAEPDRAGRVTTRLRLQAELPDRLRVEEDITYDGRAATKVDVLDGHIWRGYDPARGAHFQPGGYEGSRVLHDVAPVLDPAMLVAGLELDLDGEATCAGRRALRVRATPRLSLFGGRDHILIFLFGGTDHELLIDAERGVLLRLETRFDGQAFRVLDVEEISFDGVLPAATWEVEAPDGEALQPLAPSHVHPISLAYAVAKSPSKLFLPERAPDGAELSILAVPSFNDPAQVSAIAFAYSWTGATQRVQINEAANPPSGLEELGDWHDLSRDGIALRVYDGGAEPSGMHLCRYVLRELEGTHITISGNLELDELTKLATTLRPVNEPGPPDRG